MRRNPVVPYESVAQLAIRSLGCGPDRLRLQPTPWALAWWPDADPDFIHQLIADYGVPTEHPQLESEYFDEVAAIRDALDQIGFVPKLAKRQKRGLSAVNAFWQTGNKAAAAIGVWSHIAVPIRRRGDVVYRILPQNDVLGSPIISRLPLDRYLLGVCEKTATDSLASAVVAKRLERWHAAAVITGLLLGVLLLAVMASR